MLKPHKPVSSSLPCPRAGAAQAGGIELVESEPPAEAERSESRV